jgi:uncharacterized protein (TIGR03086 family)
MPTGAPVESLARALDATAVLVHGVAEEQWSSSTPCPQLSVRALVNHLVSGNRIFTGIVTGADLPPREERQRLGAIDHLGDDPSSAYRESANSLVAAFRQPGVLGRVFPSPIGSAPGGVLLHLRMIEALVHGWDIARATGQPAQLPQDLAEVELAVARDQLPADLPRTGDPFGPVQPVSQDAPAIDRLAAYLGRPVGG